MRFGVPRRQLVCSIFVLDNAAQRSIIPARQTWSGESETGEEPMTNVADIAREFTALLQANKHEEAAARFNAPDIVSIEAMDGPMARVQGATAVKAKGEWWTANHTVHDASAEGPFVNGDQFVVAFRIDVTPKDTGQRVVMDEAGLYTVKGGKIVEERFFY
jgi:ketosteroid isomerase-like protein